ncbi:Hypothetical protein, putative [Bodo saltans]|uniref:Uncharacterized protein n=1 Tax=Bodo saltans TaxID=75058 RepID=A0A0S4IKX7_BODSA|nr:Hypothetical protein, putative [Bodo saltans]|eukprot:CUF16606.1 Hypothetical protein, putative [Bodo saltans]
MSKNISARGADINAGQRALNKQHISDVVGSKGCYYCWLGQYEKCEESCQKVHKVKSVANDRRGAEVDVFDAVTPYFTRMQNQNHSIFDETSDARAMTISMARSLRAAESLHNDVIRDGLSRPAQEVLGLSSSGSVAVDVGSTRNSALYDKRSAAARRNPTLKSIHDPKPIITDYKYPRGAVLIPVSPYTVISVTPTTHTYGAHHRADIESGDSIWTGRLVKEGRVAQDSRSQAIAQRIYAGRAATPPSSRSPSVRSGRQRSSTPAAAGTGLAQNRQRFSVQPNVVGSHIMSGVYKSAAELPLPSVFDPVIY